MFFFKSNKSLKFNLIEQALSIFNSLRRQLVLRFARFGWLSAHIKSLNLGVNLRLVVIEPALQEEELKLVTYEGSLVGRIVAVNALTVVLRQSFGSCYVDRTFFLNSTNVVYLEIN